MYSQSASHQITADGHSASKYSTMQAASCNAQADKAQSDADALERKLMIPVGRYGGPF